MSWFCIVFFEFPPRGEVKFLASTIVEGDDPEGALAHFKSLDRNPGGEACYVELTDRVKASALFPLFHNKLVSSQEMHSKLMDETRPDQIALIKQRLQMLRAATTH
jgi:hypothetical protein